MIDGPALVFASSPPETTPCCRPRGGKVALLAAHALALGAAGATLALNVKKWGNIEQINLSIYLVTSLTAVSALMILFPDKMKGVNNGFNRWLLEIFIAL